DSPRSAAEWAFREWGEGARVYVLAPIDLEKPSLMEGTLREMKRQGFTRLFFGGEMQDLDDPAFKIPKKSKSFEVLADRLALSEDDRTRMTDAIQLAFRIGHGRMVLRTTDGKQARFHADLVCNECG